MTAIDEVARILGRRRTTRKFYRVTDHRQLLELEDDTVIRVDGQRVTAGIYGSCFRVMRLFKEGHRIEIKY